MTGFEYGYRRVLQRAIGDAWMAFVDAPREGALLPLRKLDKLTHFQRLAVLWAVGSVALALVTPLCLWLGLNFAAAAFVFLIVIVLLSLLDSFISSAIFSAIAFGCLNFFFTEPLHTFVVSDAQDVIALVAFLITSLTVTDLIRRVRSLDDAQREQARLLQLTQATIDSIPAFAASYGPDGRHEFFNERARSFFGVSSAEIANLRPWLEIHPDDIARAERAWQHSLATGTPFELEMRFRRADGQYRWHLSRQAPYRDRSEAIVQWYGVAFDIEDQKRAEAELQRSEAELAAAQQKRQAIIDTIPTLVASYGPDGKRDFVNTAWKQFTGLSEQEALGTEWQITVQPDDIEVGERRWREALSKGEPLHIEQRFRRADGIYRWHMVDRVPLARRKRRGDQVVFVKL